MQRTSSDRIYGAYRIYRKDDLDAYSRDLHEGGPWFVEPMDWDGARPFYPGFRTLAEAQEQAELWEQSRQRQAD